MAEVHNAPGLCPLMNRLRLGEVVLDCQESDKSLKLSHNESPIEFISLFFNRRFSHE